MAAAAAESGVPGSPSPANNLSVSQIGRAHV